MRRACLLAVLLVAGCQNTVGPFAPRQPQRVDDPLLSITEQQQRGRDRAKATEVPVRHKDNLMVHASDLGKEAERLREAAKARDVRRTNDTLQIINLKVRELRAEN